MHTSCSVAHSRATLWFHAFPPARAASTYLVAHYSCTPLHSFQQVCYIKLNGSSCWFGGLIRTLRCCKPRFSPQTSKYNSAALDRICPRSNACSPPAPKKKSDKPSCMKSKLTQWAVKELTWYLNLLTFFKGWTHCNSFQQPPNSLQSCLVTLISLVTLITGPLT